MGTKTSYKWQRASRLRYWHRNKARYGDKARAASRAFYAKMTPEQRRAYWRAANYRHHHKPLTMEQLDKVLFEPRRKAQQAQQREQEGS